MKYYTIKQLLVNKNFLSVKTIKRVNFDTKTFNNQKSKLDSIIKWFLKLINTKLRA